MAAAQAAVSPAVSASVGPRRGRRNSDLFEKVAMFNKKVEQHTQKQLANPFSEHERPEGFQFAKLDPSHPDYGR